MSQGEPSTAEWPSGRKYLKHTQIDCIFCSAYCTVGERLFHSNSTRCRTWQNGARKKKRKPNKRGFVDRFRRPPVDLSSTFEKADRLVEAGRADQALALLTPLLEQHPRHAELHYYIGYAHVKSGDMIGALDGYERALKLSGDPSYWLPLSSLYLETGLNAHALDAFRKVVRYQLDEPVPGSAEQAIVSLEEDVAAVAEDLNMSPAKVEQGLRQMEEGMRWLQVGDYDGAVAAGRRAIKILGDWPPPSNNLSLALFFGGQPQQAIDTTLAVLSAWPENVQALSNAIRFLTWTGHEDEAREHWQPLLDAPPEGVTDIFKTAEAAAILDEDEAVRDLLSPYADIDAAPLPVKMAQLYAVALANTGSRDEAMARMKGLESEFHWIPKTLAALKAGRPGPGIADRYPYFHSTELAPHPVLFEFGELLQEEGTMPDARFRNRIDRFVQRYPQLVLVAEKVLLEEGLPEAGIEILGDIGTPAAYAALRRFCTGKAGDDQLRRKALNELNRVGQIAPGETVRMWQYGVWEDVQTREFVIVEEHDIYYAPDVADLLNDGLAAMNQQRYDDAEQLFFSAVKLEPTAKEGYNNLAAIYSAQSRHEEADEMLLKALEVDPEYVLPRVGLVNFRLRNGDIEGAKEMLAPDMGLSKFTQLEFNLYYHAMARIALAEEQYDEALRVAKIILELDPSYEPAKAMVDRLEVIRMLKKGFEGFQEQQAKRDQAKRQKIQQTLASASPSLGESLSLLTKDDLTSIAYLVLTSGGWSTLRKAELLAAIVEGLVDVENLSRLVADLADDERDALRSVLVDDGRLDWQAFSERYDNDLDEPTFSRYSDPKTTMGRLRRRGLLSEATVDGQLLVVVPVELRPLLASIGLD